MGRREERRERRSSRLAHRVRSRDADVLRDAVADLAVGHDVIPRGHTPVEVGLRRREVVMPASMIDVAPRVGDAPADSSLPPAAVSELPSATR